MASQAAVARIQRDLKQFGDILLRNRAAVLRWHDVELLEQALAHLPGSIHCDLSTDYLETLKMMTSIGLGWSLLPATLLDGELSVLEVEGIELQRSLGVVTHAGRTLSNAALAMQELLLQQERAIRVTAATPGK